MKLELKRIGNSTGLILPKELLARLGLEQGDSVFISEFGDRSVKLSAFNPEHARVMEIGREVFKEYAETLKALAK
jgi:putative addiction module antidote